MLIVFLLNEHVGIKKCCLTLRGKKKILPCEWETLNLESAMSGSQFLLCHFLACAYISKPPIRHPSPVKGQRKNTTLMGIVRIKGNMLQNRAGLHKWLLNWNHQYVGQADSETTSLICTIQSCSYLFLWFLTPLLEGDGNFLLDFFTF